MVMLAKRGRIFRIFSRTTGSVLQVHQASSPRSLVSLLGQEVGNYLQISLWFLEERCMGRILHRYPLHFLDTVEEGSDNEVLGNIVSPIDD